MTIVLRIKKKEKRAKRRNKKIFIGFFIKLKRMSRQGAHAMKVRLIDAPVVKRTASP